MAEAIGSISPAQMGQTTEASDRPNFGNTTRIATYSALFLFLSLLIFAAYAPISGGAIAIGTVNPDGSRRVVQHLDGGIIADILVEDGDIVERGQPLMVLDSTHALADRNISQARLYTLEIMERRLSVKYHCDKGIGHRQNR